LPAAAASNVRGCRLMNLVAGLLGLLGWIVQTIADAISNHLLFWIPVMVIGVGIWKAVEYRRRRKPH
jgi:hypothetical protein